MQLRWAIWVGLFLFPRVSWSWSYLEHSFLTDNSCAILLEQLAQDTTVLANPQTSARFMALSILCPLQRQERYCKDGRKNTRSLWYTPAPKDEHAITLGDYSALVDHISQLGPLVGYPRLHKAGLLRDSLLWLAPKSKGLRGEIALIGKQTCVVDKQVDWKGVARDIETVSSAFQQTIPREYFATSRRAPLKEGLKDLSTLYSFLNPHYLDLVLQNDHHFGEKAYASWLGFHAMAMDIAQHECTQLLKPDKMLWKAFFPNLPWDEHQPRGQTQKMCAALQQSIDDRISQWSARHPETAQHISQLSSAPWRAQVLSALIALIYEGAGLHYLQDGFSGGHVRVSRLGQGLGNSRHMHNEDCKHGVATTVGTHKGIHGFVAFGDGYLLTPAGNLPPDCFSRAQLSKEQYSACLVAHQRRLMIDVGIASLTDWVQGGVLYTDTPRCSDTKWHELICAQLPTRAPLGVGLSSIDQPPKRLYFGTIPDPPRPYSYESLSMLWAIEGTGKATQMGLNIRFTQEMGQKAHWMRSWDISLLSTTRGTTTTEALGHISHLFHWRMNARFLINLGPMIHLGWRGYGDNVNYFMGSGGYAGWTALPEGWTKIPLTISMNYRLPVTLFDTEHQGFSMEAIQIEGHWIELRFGLAFL